MVGLARGLAGGLAGRTGREDWQGGLRGRTGREDWREDWKVSFTDRIG